MFNAISLGFLQAAFFAEQLWTIFMFDSNIITQSPPRQIYIWISISTPLLCGLVELLNNLQNHTSQISPIKLISQNNNNCKICMSWSMEIMSCSNSPNTQWDQLVQRILHFLSDICLKKWYLWILLPLCWNPDILNRLHIVCINLELEIEGASKRPL